MVLELIQKEIAAFETGFIVLRDCPEDRIGEALGKGVEKLKKSGAKQIIATSLPEGEPLHSGPVGLWQLSPAFDLLCLSRKISDAPAPEQKLDIRPVKGATEERKYQQFVQKSAEGSEIWEHIRESRSFDTPPHVKCGYIAVKDQTAAVFKVECRDKTAEITEFIVSPALRRQSIGRNLLRNVLSTLGKYQTCSVKLCSRNEAALSFLRSEGFSATSEPISAWYFVR